MDKLTIKTIHGSSGGIADVTDVHANIVCKGNTVDGVARLVEAAPDLLAALEKLIEFAQPALESQGFGYMGSFEKARAAIAKAKGQS